MKIANEAEGLPFDATPEEVSANNLENVDGNEGSNENGNEFNLGETTDLGLAEPAENSSDQNGFEATFG